MKIVDAIIIVALYIATMARFHLLIWGEGEEDCAQVFLNLATPTFPILGEAWMV